MPLRILSKPFFLAGIYFAIVALIVRQIEAVLTMKYYLLPEYSSVWSKLMMPTAGPPPPSFFLLSAFFTLLTGWGLAAFYSFLRPGLPSGFWKRVYWFTGITYGLSILFFLFPTILLIYLPVGLLVVWSFSTLLIYWIGSMIFARTLK